MSRHTDDVWEQVRHYIASCVTEGFDTREEIIEAAISYAADNFECDVPDSYIDRTTDELLAAHYQLQTQWQYPTDCDRLDNAFIDLGKMGILARQNFACCQTCGHAEMWDEIEQVCYKRRVKGYVFYHMQDTESAVQGHGLYLAYGSVVEDEACLAAIGWQIVDSLRRAGLKVKWNGDVKQRIFVDLVWKHYRIKYLTTHASSNEGEDDHARTAALN